MTGSKGHLSVEAARARILADAKPLSQIENLPLDAAAGRVLARPLSARLTQPPFDASAMDGYAVRVADVAALPVTLELIGESAAGRGFGGDVKPGQAARIFTGAPMPRGADGVVVQEDTTASPGKVTIQPSATSFDHIRPRGGDFHEGQTLIPAARVLGARDLLLAAAMGHGTVPVLAQPRIAIIATGDELVLPGEMPGPDQIVCSNPVGVGMLARAFGGDVTFLGIARDTRDSLASFFDRAAGYDVIVTLGGASVGDHDLVGPALVERGMKLDFWKIAMRPGKPLMFGRLGPQFVLGLPGNPVSAMVTARIFLAPLIATLAGRPDIAERERMLPVSTPLAANGPRAHYMRATIERGADGHDVVTPVPSQDSSLVSQLAAAGVLVVRPVGAPAAAAGTMVRVLDLDF